MSNSQPSVSARQQLKDVLAAAEALTNLTSSEGSTLNGKIPFTSLDDVRGSSNTKTERKKQSSEQTLAGKSSLRRVEACYPREQKPHFLKARHDFTEKLRRMLCHEGRGPSAITWLPDGKSFAIVDRERLVDEYLPRFFNQHELKATLDDFVSALYRWGFRKSDKHAVGSLSFSREDFRRRENNFGSGSNVLPTKLKDLSASKARQQYSLGNQYVVNSRNKHSILGRKMKVSTGDILERYGMKAKSSHCRTAKSLSCTPFKSWKEGHVGGSGKLFKHISTDMVPTSSQRLAALLKSEPTNKLTRAPVDSSSSLPPMTKSLLIDTWKDTLLLSMPDSQPDYGKDIVRAAVDALRNAY